MRRNIILFLICIVLVVTISGCSTKTYQEAIDGQNVDTTSEVELLTTVGNGYFTAITEWSDNCFVYQIVYANDTKVKYFIGYNNSMGDYAFGITPLYNADGTLQLYEE